MSNRYSTPYCKTLLETLIAMVFYSLGFGVATANAQTEVVAINSGGPAVSNSGGGDVSFSVDEYFNAGGPGSTGNTINTAGVANAAPEAVYQTEHDGVFNYTIPNLTPNGQYTVLLHFAEFYWTAAGKRVFNVGINGTPVLSNFDIYATVGANKALVETFPATAVNGQIVISYTSGGADQPKSSGIEIRTAPGNTCTTVPPVPTGLAATAPSSTSIALSWTAVAPPANCSIAYNLYGSTSSAFTPSASNLIASTSSTIYSNTGLTPSTTYYYVLEAVDADGLSTASSQKSATTQNSASGPTEIVAIHSGGAAVSNATGGDVSFVADEFYTGGGSAPSGNAVNTSGVANAAPEAVYDTERNGQFTYTIPGLAPNAPYTVLLHFAETYFTSVGARVFNVAIGATTVLPNFDIYAKAGANQALVETFTASANPSGQIVIAFTNGGADQPKVDGIEIRGASSSCTLIPSVPPTGLTAQPSSPSIIGLNWIAVTPPPNCGITYNLYRSTTSGFIPSSTNLIAQGLTTPAYSDAGLTPSTTYFYLVEAVDAKGNSAASAQATAETNSATSCSAVPPAAPTVLSATASSSMAIGLNWTAINPPAYCTHITYNVYASTTSGFTPSLSNQIAKSLTTTSFFHTSLPPTSTYYYVVQAEDEDGLSPAASTQQSATTLAPPPGLTAAASSANEIDLTFPPSTAPAPVQYLIYRSTTSPFTPAGSNQVGTTKSNFYNDVVLAPSTKYFYIVQASSPSGTVTVGGPVSATTTALGTAAPFWDASNIPATPSGDVMTFKFLNRTNGQYPDSQVFWSVSIGGVTTTNSIAAQPYFQMPANASGRVYFYLGAVNQNTNNYWDFFEYTIGPTFFNGNTTRVDAFGVKVAFQLTCGDGTDIAIGENAATFAEDRASTFRRYLNAVPANFQTLAELQAPYRIVSPAAGGFDTGGPYATYYNAWIQQLWTANGITIPLAGPNGDGLGSYPDLSAAIYRHVGAAPGTFNPNGTLKTQSLWGNPNTFYQTSPASYYAQFLHANAINAQQYAFPYDDAGGYSADVSCQTPKTLLVAIGW